MTPSVERIATKGWLGEALDRGVSIATHGWYDSFWYPDGFKPKIIELADKNSIKELEDLCEINELDDKYSIEVENAKSN
jgi:hypothetical protein